MDEERPGEKSFSRHTMMARAHERSRYVRCNSARMRHPSSLGSFFTVLTLPALMALGAGCSASPDTTDAPEPVDGENVSSGEQALTSNEKAAFDFFVSKGLTKVQSAGIVGNLIQESNVLPGSVQPGGPGRGIAQWSVGGRWNADHDDNVAWYAATRGGSTGSLTLQLDFIWYELETFSGYGLSKLRAASSLTSATVVFQQDFEGCGQCEQSTRVSYAQQVLSAYGGGASGGGGGGGRGAGGGGATCYSSTLGKTMTENACVQSRSDRLWYQCDNGRWVDRWNDPAECNGVHPL